MLSDKAKEFYIELDDCALVNNFYIYFLYLFCFFVD